MRAVPVPVWPVAGSIAARLFAAGPIAARPSVAAPIVAAPIAARRSVGASLAMWRIVAGRITAAVIVPAGASELPQSVRPRLGPQQRRTTTITTTGNAGTIPIRPAIEFLIPARL